MLCRFDRSVEKELKKRKDTSLTLGDSSYSEALPSPPRDINVSRAMMDMMAEATASRIQIVSQMAMQPDTELTDAVDKYAKAEAMCSFAGAIKAAEAAAEGIIIIPFFVLLLLLLLLLMRLFRITYTILYMWVFSRCPHFTLNVEEFLPKME